MACFHGGEAWVVKLLTGLILGFVVGVLATIGFLQMRTGELPSLTGHPVAVAPAPAPARRRAPADTNAPAASSETGTPAKSP